MRVIKSTAAITGIVLAILSVAPGCASANTFQSFPLGPQCPHKAPAGAVFIRHVQPPLGLGYDEYLLNPPRVMQIYC